MHTYNPHLVDLVNLTNFVKRSLRVKVSMPMSLPAINHV